MSQPQLWWDGGMGTAVPMLDLSGKGRDQAVRPAATCNLQPRTCNDSQGNFESPQAMEKRGPARAASVSTVQGPVQVCRNSRNAAPAQGEHPVRIRIAVGVVADCTWNSTRHHQSALNRRWCASGGHVAVWPGV